MVAKELISGRNHRFWQDELRAAARRPSTPVPIPFLSPIMPRPRLGVPCAWLGHPGPHPRPLRRIPQFNEWAPTPCGAGLLGALSYFGLGGILVLEKESHRELAMRGGPFTDGEQAALMDYCETDVEALARLYPVMLQRLHTYAEPMFFTIFLN